MSLVILSVRLVINCPALLQSYCHCPPLATTEVGWTTRAWFDSPYLPKHVRAEPLWTDTARQKEHCGGQVRSGGTAPSFARSALFPAASKFGKKKRLNAHGFKQALKAQITQYMHRTDGVHWEEGFHYFTTEVMRSKTSISLLLNLKLSLRSRKRN